MKIPKKIQIVGRNIQIEFTDEIQREEYSTGTACYHKGKIQILPLNTKTRNITEDEVNVAFLHEALHFCINIGCDEKFNVHDLINPLSELLYQVIKQIEE
jgi:hypothetical protein